MGNLHHLAVGCADASVIITDSATFLVDCHKIHRYSNLLPSSKRLRGVFITHQHEDHYSGLNFPKDQGYSIDHLVYCPYERRRGDNSVTVEEWDEFNSLKDHFVNKGTKSHDPYRQDNFASPWWDTDGIKVWMLGPYKSIATSDTRELHDACLVFKIDMGNRKCLFTGDASDINLRKVADNTTNMCDDILHASHHGSLNGADLEFIKKCNITYTVISTESGVYENVPDPTALRRYQDNTREIVYRTDKDGTLKWDF